jgi:hypothetical protein
MKRLMFLAIATVACGASGSWGDDSSTEQPGADGGAATKDASVATKDGGATQPKQDAGPSDAAVADDTNYNTQTICTSGQTWTGGSTKSVNMEPGLSCRTCHVTFGQAGTKDFDISGTVYPTAHEPDLCNGIGGMTVVITDAKNTDHVLQVNSVGNFYNDDGLGFLKIPTPYTAKVVSGSNVRAMITSQTNGDCNACHTEQGTQSAPGRIMAP